MNVAQKIRYTRFTGWRNSNAMAVGLAMLVVGTMASRIPAQADGLEQGTGTFRWSKAASITIRDGDMDVDGDVDFGDIAAFVQGLTESVAYEATFGLLPVIMGDTDHDGDQDFDDIGGFVAILIPPQATSAAQGVPEPASVLLLLLGQTGLAVGLRRRHREV